MTGAYFYGHYFKHQKNGKTVAFIPGLSNNNAFIQIITNNQAYYFSYPKNEYKKGRIIIIGNCKFSKKGIIINIKQDGTVIKGRIAYAELTPIKYDIMGPFKYFSLECRHGIVSMRHKLNGWININGELIDFNGGIGYIEGDNGTSFPKSYVWVQCNDFNEDRSYPGSCSIFASVADIPFMGFNFKGCISVVYYKSREYRLATYLGVKIIKCNLNEIILKQGRYILIINILQKNGQKLIAPRNGKMMRGITEYASCEARFRFYKKGKLLFDFKSKSASFEWVGNLLFPI